MALLGHHIDAAELSDTIRTDLPTGLPTVGGQAGGVAAVLLADVYWFIRYFVVKIVGLEPKPTFYGVPPSVK